MGIESIKDHTSSNDIAMNSNAKHNEEMDQTHQSFEYFLENGNGTFPSVYQLIIDLGKQINALKNRVAVLEASDDGSSNAFCGSGSSGDEPGNEYGSDELIRNIIKQNIENSGHGVDTKQSL
eukprot:246605_1